MIRPGGTPDGPRHLVKVEAVDHLARRFGVSRAEKDNGPSPELLAEAVREVVFRYSLRGGVSAPVHVQSITNQLRRELAPIWPALDSQERLDWLEPKTVGPDDVGEESDNEEPPIRRCLEILARVGDVQHVGSGYWLPTPTRLVQLASDLESKVLLIGGAPLYQLRMDGYRSVDTCGNVRALPLKVVPQSVRQDDTVWQSLEDWIAAPWAPLLEWASLLLQRASADLSPSHTELGSFEIYDPASHQRESQFFRWTAARIFEASADRLYLCRSTPVSGAGPRRYWVGKLAQLESTPRALSEYPLSGPDIRRLQYALDAMASAPTRGSVTHSREGVHVSLSSYLPDPEYRLLMAVGEDCSVRPGRLPMTYRIPPDVAEPVLDRVTGLGVQWR